VKDFQVVGAGPGVLVQTLDNNLWYLYSGRPNSPNPYYWVDGYVAQFQAHPSDPSVIMVLSASDGKLWREHWDMNDRQKIADGVTSFQDPVTNYPSPVIFMGVIRFGGQVVYAAADHRRTDISYSIGLV
jgi:hypothetical protein